MSTMTRRELRLPNQAALLTHLDFRAGKCRDLISAADVPVSGSTATATFTRGGQAINLTAGGSDYVDTLVEAPPSGSAVILYRDTAGAGVFSPVWSNGFGATALSVSLRTKSGNSVFFRAFHDAPGFSQVAATAEPDRVEIFTVVGMTWGQPGDVVSATVNQRPAGTAPFATILDPGRGTTVHLNTDSQVGATRFGSNEFGFFAMWNRPLHDAQLMSVARQLMTECEL